MNKSEFDLDELLKQYGIKQTDYSDKTRLSQDLGLDGDEAEQFMEDFKNHFNIDMTSFEFCDFFHTESVPFELIYQWICPQKQHRSWSRIVKLPIHIYDLKKAIESGVWSYSIDSKL